MIFDFAQLEQSQLFERLVVFSCALFVDDIIAKLNFQILDNELCAFVHSDTVGIKGHIVKHGVRPGLAAGVILIVIGTVAVSDISSCGLPLR